MLDVPSLGAYALFFAGFNSLAMAPARLIFLPAEIEAAAEPGGRRLILPWRSILPGAILAVLAGLLVTPIAFTIPAEIDDRIVLALAVTAALCAALSPLQDHVRRMLHIGGRSWGAATVSGVQLATVAAAIVALDFTQMPAAWHPLGALAAANLTSGAVGLAIWHRYATSSPAEPARLVDALRSGKWLFLAGMAPHLGGLGAGWLVAYLAGATALGYAEAARIVARPIAVLSVGLKAVLGPQLMRAGASSDFGAARHVTMLYCMIIVAGGGLYLLLGGFDVIWNPLAYLVPTAYAVSGLAAATITVYVIDRLAGAGASLQLMGAGKARILAMVEVISSIGQAAAGATALVFSAFAVPVSYLVGSLIRQFWLQTLVRRLRDATPHTQADPQASDLNVVRVSPAS